MKADVGVSASQLGRAGRPTLDETGRFVAAAIVGAAGIVVFVLWVGLLIGGERVAGAVEDLTPALAAMVAAASCALAARRAEGRRRVAWSMFGTSAFFWGLGQIVTAFYELVLGLPQPPIPSLADVAYLIAYPAAIVGVMAVPTAPSRASTRGRAIIDAGIIASALLFVSWNIGPGGIYRGSTASSVTGTDGRGRARGAAPGVHPVDGSACGSGHDPDRDRDGTQDRYIRRLPRRGARHSAHRQSAPHASRLPRTSRQEQAGGGQAARADRAHERDRRSRARRPRAREH